MWWFDRLVAWSNIILTPIAVALIGYVWFNDPKVINDALKKASIEFSEMDLIRMAVIAVITFLAAFGILVGKKVGYVVTLLCTIAALAPLSKPLSLESSGFMGTFPWIVFCTFRIAGWFGPALK
ncbi:MAG TPA: hypothetical protein VK171_08455 [Fimbriimonas sp.]|nr:hypothetical protein [Fimbriimonas sp.]